jgi:hypothetical protein
MKFGGIFFPMVKSHLGIRLGVSKTRGLCPSEAKTARFQASLSSPFWRGTMPAQPSNGFLNHPACSLFSLCLTGLFLEFFSELKMLPEISFKKVYEWREKGLICW